MIRLEHVCFAYDSSNERGGIRDVSLHIQPGECVVLCGASGCGKTTLLRLMSGLAPKQYPGELEGIVSLDHKVPSSLTSEEKARTIGMVFQDPRSQFFMSNVMEELVFSGENLGLGKSELNERSAYQAEQLGITHLLHQSLSRLSSGQKQRVAIASSCFLGPSVLFLDEPTANLDREAAKSLVDILCRLKARGVTVVISEHRLFEFLPVADRFIYINSGEIVRQWSGAEFARLSGEDAARYGLRHPSLAGQFAAKRPPNVTGKLVYEIKDLSFCYKNSKNGFRNISAAIKGGQITAIVGQNGAGKTTLCKILCGLLRPHSGAILKNGVKMSKAKLRLDSYFVMQDADYQLFCESVGNELVLGRRVTADLKEKAYTAMDSFGLTVLKDRHPASLSGGEKQRVTLAATYCSDASLIVLDEPTSGLDAQNAHRVAEYARKLCDLGKAVVVITHDPLLVVLAGDQVIRI